MKIDPEMKGWVTTIAWIAAPITTALFAASMVQGIIALNNPDYIPQGWQAMLIMDAVLLVSMVISTWLGFILPAIEIMILILHIIGFFAVFIPMAYLGPRGNEKIVFTTFYNFGGWPTQGLAFFVGLQGFAAAFLGKISTFRKDLLD
jgi:choline transport protein